MNKSILLTTLFFLIIMYSCQTANQQTEQTVDYTQFVDPLIGSGDHGHVFVGASVPFGAVQAGPNNETQGWDWCSGYHYSDSVLIGFAHTQLSGTGIGDLGDIVFMPVTEDFIPEEQGVPYPWKSKYAHENEEVKPGYYKVLIQRYNIVAELTATERVAFHRYTFPENNLRRLVIDLKYGTGWDKISKGEIRQLDQKTINGYRFSTGWARDQKIFFHTEFSEEIQKITPLFSDENAGTLTVLIEFGGKGEMFARTAISPVSEEGAQKNMLAELNHWDFEKVMEDARRKWNHELSKIKISPTEEKDKTIFYTALYHTMIAPSLFNDADGTYRGADGKIYPSPGHNTHTIFSLWDTYRAAHPLYTLVQPERMNDFVGSMLDIYDQQGKLPVWHLHGNETNTMVGYHAVPVIVDAWHKGFRDFSTEKAYEAIKSSAMRDEKGVDFVKTLKYIPADTQVESVARGMEYAIDDWCIASMANALGKSEDAQYFGERAGYYAQYYDPSTRFMRGKMRDGSWRTPFNPVASQHNQDDYCEGNAWQYLWLVPQDVEGLITLLGGDKNFTEKLDSLFIISSEQVEGASSDISGLIGQYAHGNEPGHHTVYLYAYAGESWKTARLVREICTTMYTDKPAGICGNEDCGQMSAWYILSSLGFYPVNPANGAYVFGSPMFTKAEITLPGGKSFSIIAENNSRENMYIQSVTLNGEPYHKGFITHNTIVEGGTLTFVMGEKPNPEFAAALENRPMSVLYK